MFPQEISTLSSVERVTSWTVHIRWNQERSNSGPIGSSDTCVTSVTEIFRCSNQIYLTIVRLTTSYSLDTLADFSLDSSSSFKVDALRYIANFLDSL
jgi:hypothetical protein